MATDPETLQTYYTAMIADRRCADNGKMAASNKPRLVFLCPTDEVDESQRVRVKSITLHYGRFNGIAVWTAEPINT